MFENKLNQLLEIVNLEKETKEKNLEFFANDELYKRILKKYEELLNCLKTKNKAKIIEFLKNLVNYLKEIINKCSNPESITSTFEVVIDNQVPDIENAYELDEYFNIVFNLYNLFLNREFNRSDYLKYSFSLSNLDEIINQVEKNINNSNEN